MIIGGIVGHGNALINPILHGWPLFDKLSTPTEDKTAAQVGEDVEQALKVLPEKALP